jgi:circadian clock protein KaiC
VIAREIGKLPTAIAEFDYISYDGVPKNCSTLIAGTAGAGKTLLALQVLHTGIKQVQEGVVLI